MAMASMAVSGAQLFKSEGNEHFQAGDYARALRCYTDGIGALRSYTPSDAREVPSDVASPETELLVTLLSNRSETLLRMNIWEEALTAANEALALDPAHKKSLKRQKKAEEGLQVHPCATIERTRMQVLIVQGAQTGVEGMVVEPSRPTTAAAEAATAAAVATAGAGLVEDAGDNDGVDAVGAVDAVGEVTWGDESAGGKGAQQSS